MTATERPVGATPRGFGIWSEFTDRYGQKITVVDSSLATEACVWVQPADGQNIHLNQIQATELRDALSAWLSGPDFVYDAALGLTPTTPNQEQ